jgi:peptidoglycan biosynthesis protein MviN/MurJ (putative lipid II flippase)
MVNLPVSIVLNLVFIPSSLLGVQLLGLGAKGAAIAALVGAVISYVIVRALSYKLVPIGINMCVVKHLAAGAVMAVSVFLLEHYLYGIDRWYDLAIYTAIGGGIYLTLVWAMGEFKRSDALFFIDTLNARKMYDYISRELMGRG